MKEAGYRYLEWFELPRSIRATILGHADEQAKRAYWEWEWSRPKD